MSTASTESPGMSHQDARPFGLLAGWRTSFALGLITLVLGLVVIFRPTLSLIAIGVLLGATMIVSGIFHLVRALDGHENQRVWRSIVGVLSVLAGLVLIRHLNLSLALIGLFIGFTWVIQGIGWLMEGFSGGRRDTGRGWALIFGIVSLIAGIVVVTSPISSVATLTLFMGAWFIVLGALEMYGSVVHGRAAAKRDAGPVTVPGQRTETDQAAVAETTAGTAASPRPASRNAQG